MLAQSFPFGPVSPKSQEYKKAQAIWNLYRTKYNCGALPIITKMCSLDLNLIADACETEIRLNMLVLARYPKILEPVLAHELAHVVQDRIYSYYTESHGAEFREIMASFGYEKYSGPTIPLEEMRK